MLTCIFSRCKATRTAVSMRWSAPLIASGATLREIGVWGKPGTTSGCVLTLTSSTLWQPGRNVAACTFRRSCVAPLCCCMRRPSLPAQVCPDYNIGLIMFFYNLQKTAWSAFRLMRLLYMLSQMSLLHGPTCATSSQHCSIYILMVSFTWTLNLRMSSWPPLDAWSWETLGCCLSSEIKEESLQRMMCRRETRGTWHLSCSVGSMDLPQMSSGTHTNL